MKPKHILWIALVAVLLGVAIWFSIPRGAETESANPSQKKPPPLVKVEPVQVASIAATLELTGEVLASNSAVISTMKEGRIEFCPWREGDTVKSGATLVLIDREIHRSEAQAAAAALNLAQAKLTDLMAGARPEEIRNAEANLRRSQATLNEARRSYERQAELFEQDVVSKDALDKAQERLEVAEAAMSVASDTLAMLAAGSTGTELAIQQATVSEAAARLSLAEAHLAECVITAPFSGTIAAVHIRPGDIASLREPLVEIFDPTSLVVRFAVPEAQAVAVHTGMAVEIAWDASPDESYAAEVSRIYPALDPIMRTRTIEVVLGEPGDFAPHMFVRLALMLDQAEQALVVPVEAVLVMPNGKRQLYVIEDGKAVQRKISTGIEDGVRVQIVSGVTAGEKVAVAGNEMLKPDMPVRIAKEPGGEKKPGEQGAAQQPDGQEAKQTPGGQETKPESEKGSQP